MIQLGISFLPFLLLFYFLYRALEEPVFFIGIPFLMFLKNSIFFEKIRIFSETVNIFTYPVKYEIGSDIHLFAWLIIFWIIYIIRSKKSSFIERDNSLSVFKLNILDYCIIGLLVISVVGLIMVLNDYYVIDNVFEEFFTLISLFIGYFIMKSIVNYNKLETLSDFLFNIVLVNSIASCLYIIHQGLHIVLYQGEEYNVTIVMGEEISRTFWFAPVLWFFSVSYLLVFKKIKSPLVIGLLGINMLAIFLSYTRSALITTFILIILYYFLFALKNRDYSGLIKNIFIGGIFSFVFFLGVSYFLPASTNYFIDRFDEIKIDPNDKQSNTLIYRFSRTSDVIGDLIDDNKSIYGFGPVTETQLPQVDVMRAVTADMVWTGVIFRWGYVGFVLFVILYLGSLIKAFNLFIKNEGIMSKWGLLFFLIIISQVLESFVSWTFFSDGRFPLGLWYLGILSGLVYINKKANKITEYSID